jgi:hypothetical protein
LFFYFDKATKSGDILTIDFIENNMKNLDENSILYHTYFAKLLKYYKRKEDIDKALKWAKNRANDIKEDVFIERALDKNENHIVVQLIHIGYPREKEEELLLYSAKLSKEGKKTGASFLKNLVYEHIKYLIDKGSKSAFEYLDYIEKVIQKNFDKADLHWFEYRIKELKQYYLTKLSKEKNITMSIRKYNQLQQNDYLDISSIEQLKEITKSIIDEDIRLWIEVEGAYKHINELAKKKENLNAEDFIQKSVLSQIKLAFAEKGFRKRDYSIKREEQLLDDKRLDFTVSYGFIGNIMIELKLSHNPEAKDGNVGRDYIKKLKTYMSGSNSKYGLFVIFNIKEKKDAFKKTIIKLKQLYKDEPEITVIGIDCFTIGT